MTTLLILSSAKDRQQWLLVKLWSEAMQPTSHWLFMKHGATAIHSNIGYIQQYFQHFCTARLPNNWLEDKLITDLNSK